MSTATTEYCVVCGGEQVRHENQRMDFDVRGETIQLDVPVKVCPTCGTVEQLDTDPAEMAFTRYRKQKGLLTPDEIKETRKRYSLSQKSLAALLGMSEATINRYEGGGLQNEAHDQAIRSCSSPDVMRDLLDRRGDRLSDWQRQRAEDSLHASTGNLTGITLNLNTRWSMPHEKSLRTGYREFNYERYAGVVVWLCCKIPLVTVTSLNKLLFYVDFTYFKSETVSLTGTAYRRLQHGPVPAAYGDLKQTLEMDEIIDVQEVEFNNGNTGEQVTIGPKAKMVCVDFTKRESEALEYVAEVLKSLTPTQIRDLSHKETAWTDTEDRVLISYDKAEQLSLSLPD